MVSEIKEVEKNTLIFVKVGAFYEVYFNDAALLSYFFGYKINTIEGNVKNVGFPVGGINKVITELEKRKINYMIVKKSDNYDVEKRNDNKNLNKYEYWAKKAKVYVNNKFILDSVYTRILSNVTSKKGKEVLDEINTIVLKKLPNIY